ncbi:hypothetical protein [Nocardioides ferulae]|uniref:hypothetical protein n=1 Tax=Nocardioides ferulae TaxID=2340821 RepID=UPI000F893E47|nr:hypothetical protein [Nocardioides ferulae]
MRRSLRMLGAASALLVLTLAAGCGDDGSSESTGPNSPAPSSSSEGAAEPSPSGSEPASESGSSVTPASGPLLTQPSARLRAPEGWESLGRMLDVQVDAGSPRGELISFFDNTHWGAATDTLDDVVAASLPNYRNDDVERQPDVQLDGQPAYHLAGWSGTDPDRRLEEIGTVREGRLVTVKFRLERDAALRTDPDIVASVLATFEWRD